MKFNKCETRRDSELTSPKQQIAPTVRSFLALCAQKCTFSYLLASHTLLNSLPSTNRRLEVVTGKRLRHSSKQMAVSFRTMWAFAVCMLPQQLRQREGGIGTAHCLNRIVLDPSEVDHGRSRALLPAKDRRSVHIRDVLRKTGASDCLRVGVANEYLVDLAPLVVEECGDVSIELPEELRRPPPPPPRITLLLALPRPKVLQRLLPHISAIGVRRIVLTNAYKVERAYFDSDIVKRPLLSQEAILDGVMQAGVDVHVPLLSSEKRLKVFLEDTLNTLVSPDALRLVAEPDEVGTRIANVVRSHAIDNHLSQDVVLAIGPEGGWMPREIYMLEELHGFKRVTLGSRVLRTDAAVIVALGLLHDALERENGLREK